MIALYVYVKIIQVETDETGAKSLQKWHRLQNAVQTENSIVNATLVKLNQNQKNG